MTNKAALVAALQTSVPDDTLEKALADGNIISSGTYSSTSIESIDRAAISVLWGLLSSPDVSEGGYSIRYDRKAVQARLLFLAKKYGVTEITDQLLPTIRSPKVW